jgi:hypothetical protein
MPNLSNHLGIGLKLQMLATVVATVAAWIQIESIIVSVFLVVPLSLFNTIRSIRNRNSMGLLFASSLMAVAVLCFFIIYSFRLQPGGAHFPIGTTLLLYAGVFLWVGALTLVEAAGGESLYRVEWRFRLRDFRFSLMALLVAALIYGFAALLVSMQGPGIIGGLMFLLGMYVGGKFLSAAPDHVLLFVALPLYGGILFAALGFGVHAIFGILQKGFW